MCFNLLEGVLTSFFLYTGFVTMFTYIVLIFDDVCLLHLSLRVLFFFLSLYTCFYLYTIYYFCFTQRCLDEFCLKYFRNTDCQSLLAINSLLAKFFKSLCYDRFYCIQQVNMSLVIYDFSHIFICLLWFCHGLPNRRLSRHM